MPFRVPEVAAAAAVVATDLVESCSIEVRFNSEQPLLCEEGYGDSPLQY